MDHAAPSSSSSSGASRLSRLEALRGFAAAYVLTEHIFINSLGNPRWALPFRQAQSAVMLFFILSGFVICYSTGLVDRGERPRGGFRDYFVKRFRRIYPLFITAMAIGYLADCLAQKSWLPIEAMQVVGNLLMLHDAKGYTPGAFVNSFHDNPLWSLSYEWWYYMMFYPLLIWNVPWGWKKWVVLGLALIGLASPILAVPEAGDMVGLRNWTSFPHANYWRLFPIWWAGVEMAREYQETRDITLVRQAPMIVILFFFAMVFGVWWMLPDYHVPNTNRFEAAEFKHFLSATLLIPLGLMWRRFSWRGFRWVLGPFEKLAPISYALYVFHMPMIVALMAVADRPGTPAFLRTPAAFLVLLLGAVALFSWLMEVQVQRVINRLTGPLLSPRRSTDS